MRLVVKFGGTSIKTPARMRSAARNVSRLAGAGHQILVVVSAMGDTTNRLMRRGREVWRDAPFDRHFLELLSSGEAQSASLMAMALKAQGCEAQAIGFDNPRWPIVAAVGQSGRQNLSAEKVNDPVDVRLDAEETTARFASFVIPLLAARAIPVFPGFFIRDRDGGLVTLGRGGSDVSAFLVGRFARADEVVIVTDVKGVLTADPRVVSEPAVVPEMDAGLLSAISHRGAQVLHPNSLRYKDESLTARVVHFRELGRPGTGTKIKGVARTALSITSSPLTLVLLFGERLASKSGVLGRLGGFLAERGVSIHSLTASDRVVGLYIETAPARKVIDELHGAFVGTALPFAEILATGPVAEIVLSNPAFIDSPGVISTVSDGLSRGGVNIVEMVTSHADIMIYCRHADAERAAAILTARLGIRARPDSSTAREI